MKVKLTKEEKKDEALFAKSKGRSIMTNELKAEIQAAAKEHVEEFKRKKSKEAHLNMRVEQAVIDEIKKIAEEEGIGYQPLIHRVLKLYVRGELLDAKTIKKLLKKAA